MKKLNILSDSGLVEMEIINNFEKKVGYYFPNSYKELVHKFNGLYPVENMFHFLNIYNKKDERDIYFLGYGDVKYDKIEEFQKYVSEPDYYGEKGLVAFAGCANGDYICFDYRSDVMTDNPKIVLMYHDDYTEYDNGSSTMVINFVANTFEEFINELNHCGSGH